MATLEDINRMSTLDNVFRDCSSEDSIGSEEKSVAAEECGSEMELALTDEASLRVMLLRERARLSDAKETISSLVEQITQYKELVEEERTILETKLNEERITILELYQILKKVESEKDIATKQLETVIKECGQLEKEKQEISRKNIINLQSLMEEISTIEENNDNLEKSLEEERAKCKLLEMQLSEQISTNRKLESLNQDMTLSLGDTNAMESMRRQLSDVQAKLAKEKEKLAMADHYMVQARKSLGLTNLSMASNSTVDMQEISSLKSNLEEERRQLTRTQLLLEEEKKRSELNKRTSDNMVSRIRDLIASHNATLQQLDDEKENVKLMSSELDKLRQQLGQSGQSNSTTAPSTSPCQQSSTKEQSINSIENLRHSVDTTPIESSRQMLYKSIIRSGPLGQDSARVKGKLSSKMPQYTSNNSPVILEKKLSISTISFKQSKKLEKEIKEISRKIQMEEESEVRRQQQREDSNVAEKKTSESVAATPNLVKSGSSFFNLMTRRQRSSSSSELVMSTSSSSSSPSSPSLLTTISSSSPSPYSSPSVSKSVATAKEVPTSYRSLSRATGSSPLAVSSTLSTTPTMISEKSSPKITRKKSFWRLSSK